VRELLVTQQKACQKETYQQWLQHAIKCVDQLDLGGVADLLKQLRASEKAAL
jgi:hypothetical protein